MSMMNKITPSDHISMEGCIGDFRRIASGGEYAGVGAPYTGSGFNLSFLLTVVSVLVPTNTAVPKSATFTTESPRRVVVNKTF